MSALISISDILRQLETYVGQVVTIHGWLYSKRSSGKLHFLQVRDGSAIVQCVIFAGDVDASLFELAGRLTQETALAITGEVRRDKRSSLGFELGVQKLTVVAKPHSPYPITPKEHGTAFLMDHRHLWLRSRRQHAILRIRHEIIDALRKYFNDRDFIMVDAPIFTPNACEGTSNLFQVDYFGDSAYLTQSGQLYMEAAAMALGKVYCFGPTFRAEKSKTRRHLTEFWMLEPEVAFLELPGIMDLAEDMLVHVVSAVLRNRSEELRVLDRDTTSLSRVQKPFPRIPYQEALEILARAGKQVAFGTDFGGEDETIISQHFDRPVMIHHYPAEIKAFYMKRDDRDPNLSLGVDVIAPEGYGEVIGGGQREHDLSKLEQSLLAHQLERSAFEWYLDLRRFGSAPHGGFGLGLERTVAWICGLQHVRETIPFPRMLERLTP